MSDFVAIIGAGNGGCAIAAHIARKGAKVKLCDLFPQYVEGIIEAGNVITLTDDGVTSEQKLAYVGTDVATTVKDAKLIMVVTPSFTHKMIAEAVCAYLEDGQVIVLNPGRTGGAVEFMATLRKLGCTKKVTVAEASTLIYSCRKTGPASVGIFGTKKELTIGSLPGNEIDNVLALVNPYYPQFKPAKNCLETSLANIGALFHPTPVLLNIGRIETDKNGFKYYVEGISPSVAVLVHAIDLEKQAVAKAFGVKIQSAEEWLHSSYTVEGDDLYTCLQSNKAYYDIKAPTTIQARYVTEDVPMSLVPIAELGKVAGVPTPNIDSVIILTSTIYQQDFRKEGRSIENMGLAGMSFDAVKEYFETGKR